MIPVNHPLVGHIATADCPENLPFVLAFLDLLDHLQTVALNVQLVLIVVKQGLASIPNVWTHALVLADLTPDAK